MNKRQALNYVIISSLSLGDFPMPRFYLFVNSFLISIEGFLFEHSCCVIILNFIIVIGRSPDDQILLVGKHFFNFN